MKRNLMFIVTLWLVLAGIVFSDEEKFYKMTGDQDEHFYLPDDKITLTLDPQKMDPQLKIDKVELKITDYKEKSVFNKELKYAENKSFDISIDKYGVFQVRIILKDISGKELKTKKTSFARIRDVRLKSLNPDSRFGIGAYYAMRFNKETSKRAAKIQNMLGAAWNRDELLWDIGEPQKGKWDFSKYDMAVEASRENNILILGLVDYWGTWAKKDSDEGRKDFANYAATLVKRYKPNGEFAKEKGWKDGYGITHWEFWNEPMTFWGGTPENYALLYLEAYKAMVKEDPKAVVFFSNSDESFDQKCIDIIGKENFRGITPHYYCMPKAPEAGKIDIGMNKTEKWFVERGINVPLFSSEFGWNATNDLDSMQRQAYYLVRDFIFGFASGHQTMISYNFFNDSLDKERYDTGFGIVNREDFTPKLAYGAYGSLVYFFEGCSRPEKIDFLPDVRCYIAKSERFNSIAILWSSGTEGTLKIEPGKAFKLYDTMGNDISNLLTSSGEIPLAADPVYLVSDDDKINIEKMNSILQQGKVKGISPLKLQIKALTGAIKDKPPVIVKIDNDSANDINGKLIVSCPENWIPEQSEITIEKIKARSSIDFPVKFKEMSSTGKNGEENIYPVKVEFVSEAGEKASAERKLNELVTVYGKADIDGDLSEWKNAKTVYLNDISQVVGIVPYMDWNLSAEIKTMWDENNFYFASVVRDNEFANPNTGSVIWEGDSFQLGFYTKINNSAIPDEKQQIDDYKFLYGLANTKGGAETWTWVSKEKKEIKPEKIIFKFSKKKADSAKFPEPFENEYIYEAAIPKELLKGLEFTADTQFLFSFILNDNDGGGRRGWLEWTPGIGTGFNPKEYTLWTLKK